MSKMNHNQANSDVFAELDKMTAALDKNRSGKPTVSKAIAEGGKSTPYSVRLTTREIHRLKVMSDMENMKPAELAKALVLQGLSQLEAKHVELPEEAKNTGLQKLYRQRSLLVHFLSIVDAEIALFPEMQVLDHIVGQLVESTQTVPESPLSEAKQAV